MTRAATMTVVDSQGQSVRLAAKPLGSGGEGAAYEISPSPAQENAWRSRVSPSGHSAAGPQTWLAKLYHQPATDLKSQKLRLMVTQPIHELAKVAAWPVDLLWDTTRQHLQGFVMPKFVGLEPIFHAYNLTIRRQRFPKASWSFLLRVAHNCAAAFEAIHKHRHVIGDVNQNNILVAQNALVRLIDCDSFQIRAPQQCFRCEVGVSHFTPPELQGQPFSAVDRTEHHDAFGLAVLIFHLLFLGRHPFTGLYSGQGDMPIERAITESRFAYSEHAVQFQMQPPPHMPGLRLLSPQVAGLFERAFVAPRGSAAIQRPSAAEWKAALAAMEREQTRCAHDQAHDYLRHLPECPWCDIEYRGGPSYFVSGQLTEDFDDGFNLTKFLEDIDQHLVFPPLEALQRLPIQPSPGYQPTPRPPETFWQHLGPYQSLNALQPPAPPPDPILPSLPPPFSPRPRPDPIPWQPLPEPVLPTVPALLKDEEIAQIISACASNQALPNVPWLAPEPSTPSPDANAICHRFGLPQPPSAPALPALPEPYQPLAPPVLRAFEPLPLPSPPAWADETFLSTPSLFSLVLRRPPVEPITTPRPLTPHEVSQRALNRGTLGQQLALVALLPSLLVAVLLYSLVPFSLWIAPGSVLAWATLAVIHKVKQPKYRMLIEEKNKQSYAHFLKLQEAFEAEKEKIEKLNETEKTRIDEENKEVEEKYNHDKALLAQAWTEQYGAIKQQRKDLESQYEIARRDWELKCHSIIQTMNQAAHQDGPRLLAEYAVQKQSIDAQNASLERENRLANERLQKQYDMEESERQTTRDSLAQRIEQQRKARQDEHKLAHLKWETKTNYIKKQRDQAIIQNKKIDDAKRAFDDELKERLNRLKALELERGRILESWTSNWPNEYKAYKNLTEEIYRLSAQYKALREKYRQELMSLKFNQKDSQLQAFLEKYLIEDADIPDVKPIHKKTLALHNIVTAWDVNYNNINAVQGIGPTRAIETMKWRKLIEDKFQFNSNFPLPPAPLQKLKNQFSPQKNKICFEMRKLKNQLILFHERISKIKSNFEEIITRYAEAQLDVNVMQKNKPF